VQVIGPITSTYRWNDAIETAEEWLCLIKSRQDLYRQLEEAVRAVHPYDVPEILATPVVAGNPSYLDWLRESTSPSDTGTDVAATKPKRPKERGTS
jgi:periplasmic divalent cation tolerance protein